MQRPIALLLLAGLTVAMIGASHAVAASRSGGTLVATVGPTKRITLTTAAGKAVTALPAGNYVFVVRDRSRLHNFRLQEAFKPGGRHLERQTQLRFVGTVRWRVLLRSGSYTFSSDSNPLRMRGSFTVA
jgi:hypothetical protein